MKTFKVVISITLLGGIEQQRELEIKAKTAKSAEKKAWAKIGNQTGHVVSVDG